MSNHFLPPFLMTSDPGSYARATILERKPQIIRQVLADNAYPPAVVAALETFRNEIASLPLQPLREIAADTAFWNSELSANFTGKNWLELPWYFAESYFYRKVLEAVGYFQPGAGEGRDPFLKQKLVQIQTDIQRLANDWEQLSNLNAETRFVALLHSSLWGNRADLSNFTVQVKVRGGLETTAERHLILIDHTKRIQEFFTGGLSRMDFICDNVGSDLLSDLLLADFLLSQGWAGEIHLNLKNQPFFVSDAMPTDAHLSVDLLQSASSAGLQALGRRLAANLASGQLVFASDPFWSTCWMFRQMPAHLRQELANARLVLIKGDVNYRRLLDDRHWPYTTQMEEICNYFPAPFVTLRTMKGEIMVGLQPGQAEALQAEDPTWLINGKRGIIQLITPQ